MVIDPTSAEVYEKYADELTRFATVLAGPSGADDVVAAAVVDSFSSAGWASVVDHRSYLMRAVFNKAQDERRSTSRRLARELRVGRDSSDPPAELRVEVLDAVRRLTVRERAVVFFAYWEDMPTEDIAVLLHTSARTVQRDLRHANRQLEVLLR